MTTVSDTAAAVENVLKGISPYEAMIAGFLEMVPGIGIPIAVVQPFIPALMAFAIRGLDDIAKGNGGDIPAAIIEWMQHNKIGAPNSPVLSGPTSNIYAPVAGPSQDASAQGSG